MIRLSNKVVEVEKLFAHPKNYRKHPASQLRELRASYRRFGQFRSVVVQETANDQYIIIAGHGMVEAMRLEQSKYVHVDVIPESISAKEIEAIIIADNQTSLHSFNDEKMLAELLQQQDDFTSLGIFAEEADRLLRNLAQTIVPQTREIVAEYSEQHIPELNKNNLQYNQPEEYIEKDFETPRQNIIIPQQKIIEDYIKPIIPLPPTYSEIQPSNIPTYQKREYIEEEKRKVVTPPQITFKEFDETAADDLSTQVCQQCGKLCVKSK
jgi:hypothetical protein